jgi:hypothetical protein
MAMVIIVAIFGGFVVKKVTITMSLPSSIDAPPSSLMDSTTNPKVKTIKGKRVGRAPWLAKLRG